MDTPDLANTTLSQVAVIQQAVIQGISYAFYNASVQAGLYEPIWAGFIPQDLTLIMTIVPQCLDRLCQSVGLGGYLQATNQIPPTNADLYNADLYNVDNSNVDNSTADSGN